jgi:opacity protein-like surface antigen
LQSRNAAAVSNGRSPIADRWTAKLEYLYAGPPSDSRVFRISSITDGSADTHIVRTGLNYRF